MADPNPKTHLDIQQLIIIVKFHARQFILQARDIESKTDYFASGDNDGANVDFLKEILTKIAESYPNDPFSLCIRDGRDIVRDAACAAAERAARRSTLDGPVAAAGARSSAKKAAPKRTAPKKAATKKAGSEKAAASKKVTPKKAAAKPAAPKKSTPKKTGPKPRGRGKAPKKPD